METVKINGREINHTNPAYIIAEIGINHNGDFNLAIDTIDAAVQCGVDAVKLQTFTTKEFVHPHNENYDFICSCELTYNEFEKLYDYAKRQSITIFSTPESIKDIQFLRSLEVSCIKIASMDLNYKELLLCAGKLNVPVILSTGMSYAYEVANAVHWIESTGNEQLLLMHCVSCYPALIEDLNLSVIDSMKKMFPYPVGYSDHAIGIEMAFASIVTGACILEKHFTLSKNLEGPDHACSTDPQEMKKLVELKNQFHVANGHGIKEPAKCEKNTRLSKRRSIYASRDLGKGEIITTEDITLLTPSVPESQLEDLEYFLGRVLKNDLKMGDLVHIGVF